jgi:hypothetical protein
VRMNSLWRRIGEKAAASVLWIDGQGKPASRGAVVNSLLQHFISRFFPLPVVHTTVPSIVTIILAMVVMKGSWLAVEAPLSLSPFHPGVRPSSLVRRFMRRRWVPVGLLAVVLLLS